MENITSIQIIGTQRSGSNLLRLILNQFDEVSAPHPPHVLKTFSLLLRFYGDLNKEDNFRLLAQDIAAFVNANPVPWNEKGIAAEDLIKRSRNRSLLSLYETLYILKAEHDRAAIWCCKSMFNEYYAKEIEAEGINPFYIYLYRDGRDVAASFKRAIIGPKHMYYLAKNWLQDQEKALQVKEIVGSQRFCMIKYEDLLQNPEQVLVSLSARLGLSYSSKLLAYHKSTESIKTASSGELWKNVARPILPGNRGKYRSELSSEEIFIFENVAWEYLVKLGYVLENKIESPQVYTEKEILEFQKANSQWQAEARLNATEQERILRRKQEILIADIKMRFGIE